MGDCLATIDTGRKVEAAVSLGVTEKGRKPKQLHWTSTDVEWPVITLEGKR